MPPAAAAVSGGGSANADDDEPFGTTPLPLPSSADDGGGGVLRVTYRPQQQDDDGVPQWQQPVSQNMARLEGLPQSPWSVQGAAAVAANPHFVAYSAKRGLVRVLHRHNSLRCLLRAHINHTVTDLQFFQDGDVLASASHRSEDGGGDGENGGGSSSSRVVIWRVHERASEIGAEIMLEIVASSPIQMTRVIWHPFNPNQFWMLHTAAGTAAGSNNAKTVATLVESTRIATRPDPADGHAVAAFDASGLLLDGATAIGLWDDATASVNDLCWNARDPRCVLTGHADGAVAVWDLQHTTPVSVGGDGATVARPARLHAVRGPDGGAIARCLFLPHEDGYWFDSDSSDSDGDGPRCTPCFATGSNGNRTVTLWSAASQRQPPRALQQVTLRDGGSESDDGAFLLSVCHGPAAAADGGGDPAPPPPACFVVACSTARGRLYALHCRAAWSQQSQSNRGSSAGAAHQHHQPLLLLRGFDYVVPFVTAYPTYSVQAQSQPCVDISEEDLLGQQDGSLFDVKLFAYQSAAVQSLTLTPLTLLPPEHSYTPGVPGVTVERQPARAAATGTTTAATTTSAATSTASQVASTPAISDIEDEDFEEYDVGDDDDDDEEDEYDEAPDPSSLPSPNGTAPATSAASATGSSNPFNNWLGAIAAKTTFSTTKEAPPPAKPVVVAPVAVPLPPPPPPPPSSLPAPPPVPAAAASSGSSGSDFLSPMDMLFGNSDGSNVAAAAAAAVTSRSSTSKPSLSSSSATPMISSGHSTPVVDNTHHHSHAGTTMGHTAGGNGGSAGVVDHAAIADEVRRAVREEVRTTVLPVLRQTVTDCLAQQASAADNNNSNSKNNATAQQQQQQQQSMIRKALQPLQASVDALARQGVAVDHAQVAAAVGRSVQEPLRAALAETARTLFVPTLESVTGQVLRQVSDHLELQQQDQVNRGSAEHRERDRKLESVSQQLTTVTALVAELTKEVQNLQAAVAASQHAAAARGEGGGAALAPPPPPPPPVPQPDPAEALRQLILQLLQERKYEEAFTKAVSTNTVEMTVFCCRSADLQDVLGGAQPALSQPILLCLMQQLGTVLAGSSNSAGRRSQYYDDPTRELEWLQEIALSIDPQNPAIHRHVPAVLQQVVNNINQRMAAPDNDPALRRPLQRMLQVVRGVQMG